jgi:SAM-dependent methyltransferase
VDEHGFPDGFFDRADDSVDDAFYTPPRLVTHIDEGAIAAVGALYAELGIEGRVLDLMGSWVSHFTVPPADLTVLGMNAVELAANEQARSTVVHDLNAEPRLPFADGAFDAVVCCVSVDYLVRPVEVFTDVARVVRPGGAFVCTFSNEYRSVGKGFRRGGQTPSHPMPDRQSCAPCRHEWEAGEATHHEAPHSLWWPRRVEGEVTGALQELREDHEGFEAGERRTNAEVNAASERQVVARRPSIEGNVVWPFVFGGVAIRSAPEQQHGRTGRDGGAAEFGSAGNVA